MNDMNETPQPHRSNRSANKVWLLALLPLLAGGAVFAVLFLRPAQRVNVSPAPQFAKQPANLPPGVREQAAYKIEGDTVFVNNTICAQMGSPLSADFMGKFTSEVYYDGPIEQFKGKKLIFNQCCEHCAGNFPKKWAAERDQIMLTHGLAN